MEVLFVTLRRYHANGGFLLAFSPGAVKAQGQAGLSSGAEPLQPQAETNAKPGAGEQLDPRCRGIETVRHSVVEPLPVFLELDKVRRAAIHHAAEMGVDQVLGRTIQSSREAVIDLRDEVANSRYSEIQSSNSGGYVRYKIEQEQIIKLQGNDALKLDVSVTVCIPKTEEQIREEEEARQRKLRPPQQISGDSAVFFNPSTGDPKRLVLEVARGPI